LKPTKTTLLEKLLGKDYEVITADERLDKIADDFVEHCATRWESGKAMLVCVDKITCARLLMLIEPQMERKAAASVRRRRQVGSDHRVRRRGNPPATPCSARQLARPKPPGWTRRSSRSSSAKAQNESSRLQGMGFDIIPHRPDEAGL
jgi:type I restriction enzyme R subunit